MNKIVITGRLCRNTELNVTNSGKEVCNFTVAVDRRFKMDGAESADFFDVTAWGKTGVFVNKYFSKGDGITIEGRMESRKYTDKNGNKRTAWNVIAENVEFAMGGKGGNRNTTETDGEGEYSGATVATEALDVTDETDGELPF